MATDMDTAYLIELFFSGLTRGAIYALIALGYTMVYGIIGLINFAHGEIYMIGAFTAYIAATVLGMYGFPAASVFALAVLAAAVWAGAYGFTVERLAYKPLRNAPRLSPLISAIGMSIFLQNYVLLAQTPDFLPFPELIPAFELPESLAAVTGPTDLVILAITAAAMAALTWLIKFTRLGKAMRATAQDQTMALLLGININRVISATFVIGSALAALGGLLIASHVGQINISIGFLAGIKAFTAAVLGGIGSIPGAVLGSFILGLTEAFATGYVSSDYEDVFAFSLLVLILIFRPAGILGKSAPEKV
ncbi:branched-chain amino acid ABC transporter permease [Candidatus Electronema sp. TJ]|uniref:branched-chain amino acid ABC transporter permease n=1 Tax=Candidatus Electronema sp. TJ TaxID=3401573 RepID=UPI003AA84C37